MSDKDPILIGEDFEIDFQEFDSTTIPPNVPTISTTHTEQTPSTDYKFTVESDSEDGNNLLISDEGRKSPPTGGVRTSAFWSFEFYQQFFDVNDEMVLNRLLYSFVPLNNSNYIDKLKPMPDFYGPFWVCMTLIFSTAISGNLADFFETLGKDTTWNYDYKKVTIAGTVVFSYVTVIPALLCAYLWWRKSNAGLKLIDTLSLYGYSLTVFIPISILLCINHEWLRWILVLVLAATSGVVLTSTIWSILFEEPKQIAIIITALLAALHLALILCFKMYFFSTSISTPTPNPTPT